MFVLVGALYSDTAEIRYNEITVVTNESVTIFRSQKMDDKNK